MKIYCKLHYTKFSFVIYLKETKKVCFKKKKETKKVILCN